MKRFVYLGLAVLVVILGWCVAWVVISEMAKGGVRSLASADGYANPRVTCDRLSVSGFPFQFDLDCGGAAVTMQDVTAKVDTLRASLAVFQPTHLLLWAKGPVNLADAFTGSKQRIDFSLAEASAKLEGWRIGRVSVHAENLVYSDTLAGESLLGKATMIEADLVDIPEQHDPAKGLSALAAYASIDGLDVPGATIFDGRTSVEAELNGLPDDVRNFGEPDLIARWRAAGGTLKLVSFKGDDAQGSFDTSGEIKLDDQSRLDGKLSLSSKGVIERTGDLFPPEWKPLIIGSQAADGSYSQTLNIKAGTIFSGLIPIAEVPPLL